MSEVTPQEEIRELSALLRRWQYEYYVLGRPSVSDLEYDRNFDRLLALEAAHPELVEPDSPTKRVGSDLTNELPEVRHTIPVLSLDKAYSAAEVSSWTRRTSSAVGSQLSFVVEEKIDGISIVLYYRDGALERAVTRGNGFVGNDVTANAMTIRAVPLRLTRPVSIAVRGEVFITKRDFETMNAKLELPYANPRNLAAGTIRRIKSSEVASIPLSIFVYEGFHTEQGNGTPGTHVGMLEELDELGFRVNRRIGFFSPLGIEEAVKARHPEWQTGELDALEAFLARETAERAELPYEIDGLVVKVNELPVRERLGYTGHHPRWALAFKFEAPEGTSRVKAIEIQIGRTGRVTPVARIEPVQVGGATISNITLHNQTYIDSLELSVGDTVAVSRRGDVIPAIERVIEKTGEPGVYRIPWICPVCSSALIESGAHHFCPNPSCPAQVRGRILFFCDRGQMDIRSLGPETIETLISAGLVSSILDLYRAEYEKLLELPGFGEKKVKLIREGVETSKERPFRTVLASLGIPELGPKAAELLIDEGGFRDIESLFGAADRMDIERLTGIPGIGEKTARTILEELSSPALRELIEGLKAAGLKFAEEAEPEAGAGAYEAVFSGQTWCVTGSFERFKPRDLAMEEVKKRGGRVVSQITGAVTHLLAGEGAGSKLEKARALGVTIVSEQEFLKLLE
jgi:DNA ligase (NAD+)